MDCSTYCGDCGGFSQSGKTCRDIITNPKFNTFTNNDCDCNNCMTNTDENYCLDCGQVHSTLTSKNIATMVSNQQDGFTNCCVDAVLRPKKVRIQSPKVLDVLPPRYIALGPSEGAHAMEQAIRIVSRHIMEIGDVQISEGAKKAAPQPARKLVSPEESAKPLKRLMSGGISPVSGKELASPEENLLTTPQACPATKAGRVLAQKLYKMTYPGTPCHKKCTQKSKGPPVPKTMGWLWNNEEQLGTLKPHKNYRPGAMHFTVARIIRQWKQSADGASTPVVKKKSKMKKQTASGDDEEMRPMLEVHKKDGCYLIIMNPIKNPFEEEKKPPPDLTPIHFVITKKQKILKINQDGTCDCVCACAEADRDEECSDCCSESESDDSEWDFEFSPPIALVDPDAVKKKTNIKNNGSQYNPADAGRPAKGKRK